MLTVHEVPWDEELLGIGARALSLSSTTRPEELRAKLRELAGVFVIVKAPVGQGLLQNTLSQEGLTFREVQIKFRSPAVSLLDAGLPSGWTVRVGGLDDQQLVAEWLMSGLIQADRYSIDPSIGQVLSGRRYADFLKQEIRDGAELLIVENRDSPVAFFCVRAVGTRPYVALSGVNPTSRIPGLGVHLHKALIGYIAHHFSSPAEPVVSSTNLPALRVHVHLGYQIVDATEVYVRFPQGTRPSERHPKP